MGVLYQPVNPPRPHKSASLGPLADDYLLAHGYTQSAIDTIATTAMSSPSEEDFIDFLVSSSLAQTEAAFLWDIIELKN